jgi:hypothetical protein
MATLRICRETRRDERGLELRRSRSGLARCARARGSAGRSGGARRRSVARVEGCAGARGAAASGALDELAAMGCELWFSAAGEPVSYGLLGCCEPGIRRFVSRAGYGFSSWNHSFENTSVDLLGMDGRVYGGSHLPAHAVGERAGVLCALPLLPVEVAGRWGLGAAVVFVSGACAVGRSWRTGEDSAGIRMGSVSRCNGYVGSADVGQRRHVRPGVAVAWVVPGSDGSA